MKAKSFLFIFLVATLSCVGAVGQQLTILTPPEPFTHADALGIDSVIGTGSTRDMVCGRSWMMRHNQRIMWPTVWIKNSSGQWTSLAIDPGEGITTSQFNEIQNECAAGMLIENNVFLPIAWTPTDGLMRLPLPEGIIGAVATSVTIEGLILGNVTHPREIAGQIILWWEGEPYILQQPFRATQSEGFGTCSGGFLVGRYNPYDSLQAFCYDYLYDNYFPLSSLPGFNRAEAIDISDNGLAIGNSIQHPGVGYRPTVWINFVPTELPLPDRANTGMGWSINNRGQGVGSYTQPGGSFSYAAFWPGDGSVHAMNDLVRNQLGGIWLAGAYEITNDGRMIGVGYYPGNIARGFLLSPRAGGGQPPALIGEAIGELSQVSATLSTVLRK